MELQRFKETVTKSKEKSDCIEVRGQLNDFSVIFLHVTDCFQSSAIM